RDKTARALRRLPCGLHEGRAAVTAVRGFAPPKALAARARGSYPAASPPFWEGNMKFPRRRDLPVLEAADADAYAKTFILPGPRLLSRKAAVTNDIVARSVFDP